jgi:phosphohistidine phosphatase SixA
MALLLCRHADAVSESAGLDDEGRYLTSLGRVQARALGAELGAAGIRIERAISSPLVRAVQTAELVVAVAGAPGLVIETSQRLAPHADGRRIAEEVAGEAELILLVGHEPNLSGLAAALLALRSFGGFQKAEACLVGGGQPPRWFGSERRSRVH